MTPSKDMLLEIFKRLEPPTAVIRCAAVCRRWRSIVTSLPATPCNFGFFYNFRCLPWFVPIKAGVDLSLGKFLLNIHSPNVVVMDCHGCRLLLREFYRWTELTLIVHHPLERSSVRLPPLMTTSVDSLAFIALVPAEPGFRVAVVLFDKPHCRLNFRIWVYRFATDSWESAEGMPLGQELGTTDGQSIVVGDVVYKLQYDEKYIVAVNTANLKLFLLPLPGDAATSRHPRHHFIGKTADGRLCFFELGVREPHRLVKWVLQGPGTWGPEQIQVALGPLMSQSTVRDWCPWRGGFGAFGEGSGKLFFIVAGQVITLDLKTLDMEMLWANTDNDLLFQVYPYEVLAWPPVLKDFTKSEVLD